MSDLRHRFRNIVHTGSWVGKLVGLVGLDVQGWRQLLLLISGWFMSELRQRRLLVSVFRLPMGEPVDYLLLRDVGPLVTGGWKVLYKSRILGERN
jgi:hypothetical protein